MAEESKTFKIQVRSLEDETFHELLGEYKSKEDARRAAGGMLVQVRRNGEFIRPEEYEIVEYRLVETKPEELKTEGAAPFDL
ncbi:MAG: hypothetical protein WBE21_15195 [Candidatus Acidiferrales bacterium]